MVAWYGRYLKALLAAFGSEIDGVVWDETHYVKLGWIAAKPEPAYCDRAMMDLLAGLRRQMKAADPQKVFLASDCVGPDEPGWGNVNYAMVADGTYQDSWCRPACWSYGFFPNWRNSYWSCIWAAQSNSSAWRILARQWRSATDLATIAGLRSGTRKFASRCSICFTSD
jgi:hypothetical protein